MITKVNWGRGLLVAAALLFLLTGCTQGGEMAEEEVPVPFQLITLELSDSEVSFADSTSVNLEILIPQVKEPGNDSLKQALNDHFRAEGDALRGQIRDYMGLSWGGCEGDEVTVRWTYEVTRNDGQWLSVRRQGIVYVSGNAYPTVTLRGDNLRVVEGALQPVLLEELFALTPEEAQAYLVDKLEILGDGTYSRAALNNYFDFRSFYLTKDNLVLYYQEDQLGPHALGVPEFQIPLEELSDVMKEDSLLN